MYYYIVILIVIFLIWKFSKKTDTVQVQDEPKKYPYIEYVDTTPWKNWQTFKFLLHD